METTVNRYDIWQQKLFSVIKLSHPYKLIGDEQEMDDLRAWIKFKGDEAKNYFTSLIDNGINDYEARERTINDIILSELKFSPTDFLASIVWNKYNIELDQKQRVELYLQTKHIFIDSQIYSDIEENQDKLNKLTEDISEFLNNSTNLLSHL